ncbi:hypothetical protein D3C76_1106270 [compost metagenome]
MINPKLLLAGAILLVVAGLSAAGGAVVATWKADADHAAELRELGGQIDQLKDAKHQLELAIAEQNKGVAVAEAQTRAAQAAQEAAQQHATDLAAFSKSRMDKLDQALADLKDADAVLQRYWEMRK